MSTINETIQTALQGAGYGQYMSYARPVVAALTAREQEISEALLRSAEEVTDADEEQVRKVLVDAGLSVKEPEPEAADEEEGDESSTARILSAIDAISGRLDNLERIARNHGLR